MTKNILGMKLRSRLLESQNHRCACCGAGIDFDTSGNSSIDNAMPRTYDNSVVLCSLCASRQGSYPSLMDYYLSSEFKPRERIKGARGIIYPGASNIIKTKLIQICEKNNIKYEYWRYTNVGTYCPPDKVDSFVESMFRRILKNNEEDSPGLSNTRRIAFSGAQNHRCCYCGYRFTHEEPINTVRFYSWEHVVDRNNKENERTNTDDNLVVACHLCNSLRGKTHWTAEDFYIWVASHLELINSSAEKGWAGFPALVQATQRYAIENGLEWGEPSYPVDQIWTPWCERNPV